MQSRTSFLVAAMLAGFASRAFADCPAVVKAAVEKVLPKATITACKAEKDHGHDQFEVKVTKADGGKAEVDVTAAGKVLQIEENIALADVPAAVMKAFAAKYPKAKADAAEKQTPGDGRITYEIAFASEGTRREATFSADGKFIEEE